MLHQILAEDAVSVIVGSSGALLGRPAGVEDQERRHGQTIGILGIREEHATPERHPVHKYLA